MLSWLGDRCLPCTTPRNGGRAHESAWGVPGVVAPLERRRAGGVAFGRPLMCGTKCGAALPPLA
eukprot:14456355-Alexandrium_andersonii.AAC.1